MYPIERIYITTSVDIICELVTKTVFFFLYDMEFNCRKHKASWTNILYNSFWLLTPHFVQANSLAISTIVTTYCTAHLIQSASEH